MALRRRRGFAPVSPVRSEPLPSRAPVTEATPIATPRQHSGDWPMGLTLMVFGGIGWLSGARYTLFGWVIGLNLFFAWLGLPIVIPAPVGWWILAMIPIGLVYSLVEKQAMHVQSKRGSALTRFIVGWLLIVFTDVITTYLGVRAPAPDAWPITQTIAASPLISLVWAAILTFVSDWLIIGAWSLLRR